MNCDDFILEALDLAYKAHRGQWRDEGTPYIVHPLQVVDRINSWGITKVRFTDLWVAGILHDVVEDTLLTIQDVQVNCTPEAAGLVEELTFRAKEEEESVVHYREAKAAYIASFVSKSVKALVLKVADRLCNVADWLMTDPVYAVKYWDKAELLFGAMFDRKQEIVEVFGEKVFVKMTKDYQRYYFSIRDHRFFNG